MSSPSEPGAPTLPATLELSYFAPHRGARFEAALGGSAYALVLVDLEALPAGRPGHRTPFLLTFTGPAGARFAQGIYRLRHVLLGELEVFLVPSAPLADGLPRLVATFN